MSESANMAGAAAPAKRDEYEMLFRIVPPGLETDEVVVRVDGVLHVVHRYYRPGVIWLCEIDETQLRFLEEEEMDGLDTDAYAVAEYTGERGRLTKRDGMLVAPEWMRCPGDNRSEDAIFDEREWEETARREREAHVASAMRSERGDRYEDRRGGRGKYYGR